ncbi:MAG: tRNA pseudouridine(55) synthase TruB [Dehalococcoidia bacterium]
MTADGILNVCKPLHWSSFDVVNLVRRQSGVKRVGHAGTLDPAAEGVILICLGRATRIVEYLMDAHKTYRARIRMGVVTDTQDAEGTVMRRADPSFVTREMVEGALAGFGGEGLQVPPMFSALKRDGVPLYRHARAGRTVEREARPVRVYGLELEKFEPPWFTIRVECGRGFYVRTLAHDLGERLGCGAHLDQLVRLSVGPFHLESAIGVDALREALACGGWRDMLLPIDAVLLDWHAAILGNDNQRHACLGRTLKLVPLEEARVNSLPDGALCRAYSLDGRLVALLRNCGDRTLWRPAKVLAAAE